MRDLEMSQDVRRRFPALADSLGVIGSVQLRHLATVGGNLCNASPAADTAPSLIVLGARVAFVDDGAAARTVPVEQFFAGPGASILDFHGVLLSIDVPEPVGSNGSSFERLTPRGAMDIAIVSAASRIQLDPQGRISDIAIALGAVAPTPVRAPKAEDTLRGREATPESITKAGAVAVDECRPIDDIRGSAGYRRAMVAVMVRRSLERSLARATGTAIKGPGR
jgi:CO/xanthine dehydrogenase FAD-binding subunit